MSKPIYDINNNLLTESEIDLTLGYLVDEAMEVDVPAVEAVEEQWHYEYTEFPNGGVERERVVDVPGVEGCPAHKELVPIYRYLLKPEIGDIENAEPTQIDRFEAQLLYTALMTDTLLPEEET